MLHRRLGRTGLDVGVIGLGMEHLTSPDTLVETVRAAVDGGVNYVDIMIWRPELQEALGVALQGIRNRVLLAGHLGVATHKGMYRKTRDPVECRQLLQDLLARLRTDYLDVLHITYVDAADDLDRVMAPSGVLELARRLKGDGVARALGMSGHSATTAMRLLESTDLDVVMQPVGLLDPSDAAKRELLHLCSRRGIGVVAMKPFHGGESFRLEEALSPWQCIHYTLSQPAVGVALCGVKSVIELHQNLGYLDAASEQVDFWPRLAEFQEPVRGTCVYCSHCLPCPVDIDIPTVLRLRAAAQDGVGDALRTQYGALGSPASDCVECGECTERCPFGVEVTELLGDAARLLEK
jgi:hypothetical protein